MVGEQPVFDERPGVEQQVDALAHGHLAELALPCDSRFATHGERGLLASLDVVDQRPPVVQVRLVGHRPVHSGLRFSANAAMPSAASSVAVVIVSIGCSSLSASSADWSHTA